MAGITLFDFSASFFLSFSNYGKTPQKSAFGSIACRHCKYQSSRSGHIENRCLARKTHHHLHPCQRPRLLPRHRLAVLRPIWARNHYRFVHHDTGSSPFGWERSANRIKNFLRFLTSRWVLASCGFLKTSNSCFSTG